MTDHVYWILHLKINDGKLDEFKALADEMSAATKNEEGAIAYEWHLSEDEESAHIYERYADSAATMAHMASFANFSERFMSLVTPTQFHVYGTPDDTVRQALAGFGAVHFNQFAGFGR